MLIRFAVDDDVPWLLNQLRCFDEFSGTKLVPAIEVEAEAATLRLIENSFFKMAENAEGRRLGFICGILSPHVFNSDIVVFSELLWWVDPEHRSGGRAAMMLLNDFLAFGEAKADWIIMTLETQSQLNPRSLEKRGFRLKEHNYLLEVSP